MLVLHPRLQVNPVPLELSVADENCESVSLTSWALEQSSRFEAPRPWFVAGFCEFHSGRWVRHLGTDGWRPLHEALLHCPRVADRPFTGVFGVLTFLTLEGSLALRPAGSGPQNPKAPCLSCLPESQAVSLLPPPQP